MLASTSQASAPRPLARKSRDGLPGTGPGRMGFGMSNLERILKRRRGVDEAEVDQLRLAVMARLAVASVDPAEHPPASAQRPVIVRRANPVTPAGATAPPLVGVAPRTPSNWLLVAPLEDPRAAAANVESLSPDRPSASVDHEPRRLVSLASPTNGGYVASEPETGPQVVDAGSPAEAEVDVLYEALAAGEALDEARIHEVLIAPEAPVIEADPRSEVDDGADPKVPAQTRPGRRSGRAPAKERRRADARNGTTPFVAIDPMSVEPTACCPYCAVLLDQPPVADDRCSRCGQRMIVRSVGARVAVLTEAALPFFDAERLNEERWTRAREHWLELARESAADDGEVLQLAGELISEPDVAAARAWYLSCVDRVFRVAERDRRWDEAARIRYEQADVLFRTAGSADPPSDEVVRLHRDAIAADLQAIGEVARDAEVRGDPCCEACRVDDRRVAQIAEELRSPTLPHAGCPDGLCRCRWFLTTRDQEHLATLLRRQLGADRRSAHQADGPGRDDDLSVIA